MDSSDMAKCLKGLQQLHGVGPSIAADLLALGLCTAADVAKVDPQAGYQRLAAAAGGKLDRCVLYVLRCAAHHARCLEEGRTVAPGLEKWWNWKDLTDT